ncbi:MAG TPA: hypothetical protein VE944_28095, partial [Nostoc sp.]|uniref:hypothetical protein n=1 Tax=Nostoc sp. TaxID=1180 RepID=UPI002D52D0CF
SSRAGCNGFSVTASWHSDDFIPEDITLVLRFIDSEAIAVICSFPFELSYFTPYNNQWHNSQFYSLTLTV